MKVVAKTGILTAAQLILRVGAVRAAVAAPGGRHAAPLARAQELRRAARSPRPRGPRVGPALARDTWRQDGGE